MYPTGLYCVLRAMGHLYVCLCMLIKSLRDGSLQNENSDIMYSPKTCISFISWWNISLIDHMIIV